MNFDSAKENIQPLACGRDAKRLEIAINAELNDEEALKELQRQKGEYEEKIQNYCGNDPLETWFEYVSWVEQCFPKNGKECAIDELLKKCLIHFGKEKKYFQDRRFIKIYIKFIDTQENPVEIYQQLYNHGIGTMVADFYIGWAYYYDLTDNFNKANDIFHKGIDARAEPIEELEQAHNAFSLSIPLRLLNRDEDGKRNFLSSMEEKRQALTSLRAYKHKHVGSLRTGNVVKSSKPGKLAIASSYKTSLQNNENQIVNIFKDQSKKNDDNESMMQYLSNQPDTSITQSLIGKARDKENKKEPGPWSKSNKSQNQDVIKSPGSLAFSIMEDGNGESNVKLGVEFGIRLPPDFKCKNLPQTEYNVPLYIPESRPFSLPAYDKIMLYPGNGDEYSIEELRAWKYFKKFNVKNKFVEKYDKFWTNEGLNLKSRIPSGFANCNQKQSELKTEKQPSILPNNQRIHMIGWNKYDYSDDPTIEDNLVQKWKAKQLKNKTVFMNISLDETVINQPDEESVHMMDLSNVVIAKITEINSPRQSPITKKMKVSVESSSLAQGGQKLECHDTPFPAEEVIAKSFSPEKQYKRESSVKQEPELVVPSLQFPIYVDEVANSPVKESKFAIFQDDNHEPVFKEPQYTGTIKKTNFVKPLQMQEEPKLENKDELVGLSTEETFSTQNFVLYIKQQETSTPLQNKKRESNFQHAKETVTSKIPIKVVDSESLSSPESDVIPKQLSTIMETSETNTGGMSGTNTKSSLEDNESSKILLNCNNHTAKSMKTINNGQNLSTIHESSNAMDPSGKDASKFTTLGLSGLKLTDESITFPKTLQIKRCDPDNDELFELFSKTPEKGMKDPIQEFASTTKSLRVPSPESKKQLDNSEDVLLDFFKKSPKPLKKQMMTPRAINKNKSTIVLNDSVTIPSFKDILLTNKCDNTVTATNLLGSSIAIPKNQSILPDFTENISIFCQNNKSKLKEESDLIRFSTREVESDYLLEGDLGKSIYEPTEKNELDDQENLDDYEEDVSEHSFQHKVIDLNQTRQQIDNCVSSENINPWNEDLCNAFLEDLDFFNYLDKREDCILIKNVISLKGKKTVDIAGEQFTSIKYINKGAYGFIYKAKHVASGKSVVLKQERPPNCWEYYISIILTERINEEMLPGFLVIDFALIGNNSSIFVSDYAPYGTLLDVCNKIYGETSKHLDEFIVMILAIELFSIVDHLHSADIIHGDIKPDNLILTSILSLENKRPMLKLIDYGNAIDMKRFPPNTTFNVALQTENFVCSEMREGRPWTYQTDLYCLAGTLHVLLFGHYMKTVNKMGKVNITTKLPRYFQRTVWDRIFSSLLNVPDCRTFPNLQDFKLELKEILADKEKQVLDKISTFNRVIS